MPLEPAPSEVSSSEVPASLEDAAAHRARHAELDAGAGASSEVGAMYDVGALAGLQNLVECGGWALLMEWAESDERVWAQLCRQRSTALRAAIMALLAPLVRASTMPRRLYSAVRQLDRDLALLLGDFNGTGHVVPPANELRKFLGDSAPL